MPEGPECLAMAHGQNDFWRGKILTEIKVHSGRYKKKPEEIERIQKELPLIVLSVKSKGKFVYWILRDEGFHLFYLFQTMGMSGLWNREGREVEDLRDVRYEFTSQLGSTIYCDRRNFGTLKLVKEPELLDLKLASLGPDVLSAEWITLEGFIERLTKGKNRGKPLAQLLMDQSVISGIGNYLKAEILWVSQLSPHRIAGTLTDEEWNDLWSLCHLIPSECVFAGHGSSVLSYYSKTGKQVLSNLGIPVYSPEHGHLAVYKRRIDPLGQEVIREKTADKRTTHWVPGYQK